MQLCVFAYIYDKFANIRVNFVRNSCLWGTLKRSARAVQLFGRLAVLETHTL